MIAEDGLEWRTFVLSSGPCVMHDDPADCDGRLVGHHVVTQQVLRKHGFNDLRWATENGVPICDRGHGRHHSRHTPIPRERLPREAIEFAEGLELGWWLDRFYGAAT